MAASHRKLLEKEQVCPRDGNVASTLLFSRGLPQAARKLQEEVKAAHDEVVGLEWGVVRGYANAKPKTILRHRLAGRSDPRLHVCLLSPAP